MNILVLYFLILCLFGLICTKVQPRKKSQNFFIVVSFILMFYVRAFVEPSSLPDLSSYSLIFDEIRKCHISKIFSNGISYNRTEYGFRVLMKFVGLVSSSFTVFLVFYAILWLCAYYAVIKRHTKYIIFAIILLAVGAYGQSLFVIRQHLALAVFFLSFKYVINKELKKYLLMVLIAYLFHRTALVVLPIYFIYNTKNKKVFASLICLTIAIALFLASNISDVRTASVMSEYSGYLSDEQEGTNYTLFFIMSIRISAYWFVMKKHIWDDGINRLLFDLTIIGCIISIVGIGFSPTVRLSLYYTQTAFLVAPKMLEYAKTNRMKLALIVIFLGMDIYRAFFGSTNVYYEDYQTIF